MLLLVLVLVLWPGLEAVRYRLRRYVSFDIPRLDAELTGRLTLGIRTLRLSRVSRIAATLLRNVERDLRRGLQADADRARLRQMDCEADDFQSAPVADDTKLIGVIVRALGQDGALVAAVHIGGWSQKEAAAALGISHAAARKRCQRVIARLASSPDGLSQSDPANGFASSDAQLGADRRRAIT